MAIAGDVVIKLAADFAQFSSGMDASIKNLEQFGEQASKTALSVEGFFGLLKKGIAALGVQQAAQQLYQYGEQIQKNAVEVANLATKYKLTTDQVQALQGVAQKSGQSFEELAKISKQNADWLAKVTENAKDAGQVIGGETVASFKRMADASDDAHHKLEVLFAPLYANVKSTVLTTVANELTRINGILDAFNVDTLTKIYLFTNPLTAVPLATGALANALFGSGGVTAGGVVEAQIGRVNDEIAKTIAEINRLKAGGPNVWAGDIAPTEEKLKKLQAEIVRLRELQKLPVVKVDEITVPGLRDEPKGGGGKTDSDYLEEQIKRYEALARVAVRTGQVIADNRGKAVDDLTREVRVSQAIADIVEKLGAKYADATQAQKDRLRVAVEADLKQREINDRALQYAKQAEDIEIKLGDATAARARSVRDLARLQEQGLKGVALERFSKQESERLAQQANEAKRYSDNLESVGAGFENAAARFARANDLYTVGAQAFDGLTTAMSDSLDALVGKSNKSFEEIAYSFAKMLADMALRAALSQVFSAILGAITGPSVSEADKLMGLVPLPRRAAGGPVEAGHAYTVGEQGPETFIPSASGRIEPYAGGGMTHNGDIVVHVDMTGQTKAQGGDPARAVEFGRKIQVAVKDVIMNEKRPGGMLYSRVTG